MLVDDYRFVPVDAGCEGGTRARQSHHFLVRERAGCGNQELGQLGLGVAPGDGVLQHGNVGRFVERLAAQLGHKVGAAGRPFGGGCPGAGAQGFDKACRACFQRAVVRHRDTRDVWRHRSSRACHAAGNLVARFPPACGNAPGKHVMRCRYQDHHETGQARREFRDDAARAIGHDVAAAFELAHQGLGQSVAQVVRVPGHQELSASLAPRELGLRDTFVLFASRPVGTRDDAPRKNVVAVERGTCTVDQGVLASATGPHNKEECAGRLHEYYLRCRSYVAMLAPARGVSR
ncbi:hypothetical protein D3C72_1227270 [compost metagenome]